MTTYSVVVFLRRTVISSGEMANIKEGGYSAADGRLFMLTNLQIKEVGKHQYFVVVSFVVLNFRKSKNC